MSVDVSHAAYDSSDMRVTLGNVSCQTDEGQGNCKDTHPQHAASSLPASRKHVTGTRRAMLIIALRFATVHERRACAGLA